MTVDQPQPKNHLWKQLLGLGFACLFLWLAFRGVDPGQVWASLKGVNPLYVGLVCVSGLASHVVRAWRWIVLLKPLSPKPVSMWNSFCAVMIGYAVNVVVPRGGEVARLVAIARTEKLPWVGVLPTMFIDRLLDIALLVILLGITLVVFPSRATADLPWLYPGGVSLTITTLIGLLLLPRMSDIINWIASRPSVARHLPPRVALTVTRLSEQFHEGTRSLADPLSYPAIAVMSLIIWFLYWLNFYLMILAFGLGDRVSALECLVVFTIGSVGVLVPTPGNVGSFHFLVSQGLVLVAGVNRELALAYATLLHVICFLVVTCVPAACCLAIQAARSGSSTNGAAASEPAATEAPYS